MTIEAHCSCGRMVWCYGLLWGDGLGLCSPVGRWYGAMLSCWEMVWGYALLGMFLNSDSLRLFCIRNINTHINTHKLSGYVTHWNSSLHYQVLQLTSKPVQVKIVIIYNQYCCNIKYTCVIILHNINL